jgi:hypothetical protein
MRLLLLSTVVFLLFATPGLCQDAHSPEFYIEQGYIAWHRAKYFEAIENYTRAIEIDEATLKAGQADAGTFAPRRHLPRPRQTEKDHTKSRRLNR